MQQPLVRFGAYAAPAPRPDLRAHHALERVLGARLPVTSWFLTWGEKWPVRQAVEATATGHDLLVCLEPRSAQGGGVPFLDVLAGRWDGWLDDWLGGASASGGEVTVRFAHEPNLASQPWSVLHPRPCTTEPDVWRETWRYVVDRGRRIHKAARWQWCVDTADLDVEKYWPGADHVDLLGIDAYNGSEHWTSAADLVGPVHQRITALHPTAPVWLSEVGCRPETAVEAAKGLTKAQWLEEVIREQRFEVVSFFNEDKEHDWRIDTDDVRATVARLLRAHP